MDATNALLPFEVTTMASAIVVLLWTVTLLAAVFRWRVFDKIRVVYRFATEFERRVHRRFTDANRQRAPFGSVLSKIADASTTAMLEGDGGKGAKRLARRYEKNRGDEMLALLQRTLIGEAGGWTPTPNDAASQLPTIGHAVRFALNENPVLARLGFTSLSLAHRATDCAPWLLCTLSCAASAALIALSLQLVGGPDVFQGPSFVGFAVCLAPIVSAGVLAAFLYVFYRFFDPERLYDRTVQKLAGSLEVLWQDASQRREDSDFRLPSEVNAPVPHELVAQLPEHEDMRPEDVAFLTGESERTQRDQASLATDANEESFGLSSNEDSFALGSNEGSLALGSNEGSFALGSKEGSLASESDEKSFAEAEEAVVEDEAKPVVAAAPDVSEDTLDDEPEEITVLSDLPNPSPWEPPAEPEAPAPSFPTLAAAPAPEVPLPPPAPKPVAPLPPPAPMPVAPLPPPAPIAIAPPPAPLAVVPPAPVAAPSSAPEEEWSLVTPMRPVAPSEPITAAGIGSDEDGPVTMPEFTLPQELNDVPSPLWPDAPPAPVAPVATPPDEATVWNGTPTASAPVGEPQEEATLWNVTVPEPIPPAAPARPTVTVRRAASTPAATPSGENTGEWSLSGSQEVRSGAAPREEITQEVPLRPVTAGSGPTIVRRPAASAPPAPAAAPSALWNASTPAPGGDDDRLAVLRHRLAMVEQYLQKATADFSQGAISEAMWQEETERWSLEREKLVREVAQLVAKKRSSAA